MLRPYPCPDTGSVTPHPQPLPLPLPRPLPRAACAGGCSRGRRGAAPSAGIGNVGSAKSASNSLICRSGRSWTTLPASAACRRQPNQAYGLRNRL